MNSVAVFCFVISANRDVDLFPALSCAQRERTPLFSSSVSYQFNIDTACVELVFDDRSQISIDFTAVESEAADNRFQRSELDYLIYNDPLAYADLILNSKLNVLFE